MGPLEEGFKVASCELRVIGLTTDQDDSATNEEVKGNRLKNSIHRRCGIRQVSARIFFTARFAQDAKAAKGVFVGFVQILEERPQLNTLRCHCHEFHRAGSGSGQNQALTGD